MLRRSLRICSALGARVRIIRIACSVQSNRARCLAADADLSAGLRLIRGTLGIGIGIGIGKAWSSRNRLSRLRPRTSGNPHGRFVWSRLCRCHARRRWGSPLAARSPPRLFAHPGRLLLQLSQPMQRCGVIEDVGMPAVCAGTQRGELVGVVHSLESSLSDPVSTGRLPGVGLSMQITGFRSRIRTRRPSAPARPSAVDSRTAPAVGSLAPARTATECALANRISRNPCSRARDLCRYARTATNSRPRRRVR